MARESLAVYSSATSRKDFTAHQLFAILALKTDYWDGTQFLADFAKIRDDIGLTKVRHYSTVCYAAARLLKKGEAVAFLLGANHVRRRSQTDPGDAHGGR